MSLHNERPVAIVTGASSGIGKEAVKSLLCAGWQVIGIGRDNGRIKDTQIELGSLPDTNFNMLQADLSLLSETARLADEIKALAPRIDTLICNAGGVRETLSVSTEGHEATFAANHLAHFLLTQKLLPVMVKTAGRLPRGSVRIVSTSSDAHEYCPAMNWDDLNYETGFSTGATYCQAKLANVLFTRELAKRVADKGIIATAYHPGPVTSNFWSHGDESFQTRIDSLIDESTSPQKAAEMLVWLASSTDAGNANGQYFFKHEPQDPSSAAMDDGAARKLWEVSEAMVSSF